MTSFYLCELGCYGLACAVLTAFAPWYFPVVIILIIAGRLFAFAEKNNQS